MSVSQISVFLESKPGHLRPVLDAFEDAARERARLQRVRHGRLRHRALHRGRPRLRALDVLQWTWAPPPRRPTCCACGWTTAPGELARVMGVMADCGINVHVQLLAHLHLHRPVREGPRARRAAAGGRAGGARRAGRPGAAPSAPTACRRVRRGAVRPMADLTVKGAALAAGPCRRLRLTCPSTTAPVECALARADPRSSSWKSSRPRWPGPTSACRGTASAWTSSAWRRATSARSKTCGSFPFTDKAVLRDTFPYGLFAVPLDEVVELHASSGTTGKPIVVGYNAHDMDVWSDCIARLAQMAGVVPRRPRADGVRLRHVHRRLRPALRAARSSAA